ncbi:PIG-L deacetylase family protein [Paenibacillus sp. GCM10023252]|uniref:PIG-L deacetylase family protein n=1 Tax=Paenibacillus sp. GCM10023252 TaxID=3252649 RepID=UPI00361F7AA0
MRETIAFVYAHPDDETFLSGGLIRQLADQGNHPVLLLATYGDAGKKNGSYGHYSNAQLAELRKSEMTEAAHILGINAVNYLGHEDGKLNAVHEGSFIDEVAAFLNEHKPSEVYTFPENGGNEHPDHIAISYITTAAVLSGRCPSVKRLYYADVQGMGDGEGSFRLDIEPYWKVKAKALQAHDSQIHAIHRFFGSLEVCPPERKYESFRLRWTRPTIQDN